MTQFISIGDIVESNGKTVRENNLGLPHNIPVGSLVEVQFDSWFGRGACWKVHARLWVVKHSRDCDGTPLYVLSTNEDIDSAKRFNKLFGGFSEDDLKVIPVTLAVAIGDDCLEWEAQ